jgi:hypothetical protein
MKTSGRRNTLNANMVEVVQCEGVVGVELALETPSEVRRRPWRECLVLLLSDWGAQAERPVVE